MKKEIYRAFYEAEMNEKHILKIAGELKLQSKQVTATAALLEDGGTVPFISRYRKEATGSLDEVAITAIRDRLDQLKELDTRREAIVKSLTERELLTDDLQAKIGAAETMAVLEDIYLPFRPKRRTRAMIAKEKGLEPLADMIFAQENIDPEQEAKAFVGEEKLVLTVVEALAGARDIIAEKVNEDSDARSRMREYFRQKAMVGSRMIDGKEDEGAKYKDYFEWSESISSSPSHRVLAMMRGEKEGVLALQISPPEDEAVGLLKAIFVKGDNSASLQVKQAVEDSYKRLLAPSMETEIRVESKKRADEEAIRVFAENLRELLLTSPLGQKNMLAIDPGFRTGCKVVCLDRQGKLLHHDVIYPTTASDHQIMEAAAKVKVLCEQYQIEAIAIGNGTAGRETETFVRKIGLPANIVVVMVNESGASVYSASDVARKEFPDQDVTVRGSVSIGRRLMDPLAELVKIDPKSIGVGQYQHDVDQGALKRSLDDVVMSCVNNVGVEVNTASAELLTYVSGLGPVLAKNIVNHRNENGPFQSRKDLTKVARLGPKAFEQAGGFLRVRDGGNPLDASAVHPESYPIVDAMAKDLDCSVTDLMRDASLRQKIDLKKYMTETVGLPTLNDIMSELAKPGRDPREKFEVFQFADGVEKIEDVQPGMKLPGIVTNVTAFGAFVDIGVHQDGLVHISQLSDQFIKDPSEVVKVQQKVEVTVMEVDIARKRISLTMKKDPEKSQPAPKCSEPRQEQSNRRPQNQKPDNRRQQRPAPAMGGGWFSKAIEQSKTEKKR
jgi:uncharacterized protein